MGKVRTTEKMAFKPVSEAELQQHMVKELDKIPGCTVYKVECRGQRGFPDLFIGYQGRVYLAELKTVKGDPSPRQVIVSAELAKAGIPTYVLKGAEQIDEFITNMKYGFI